MQSTDTVLAIQAVRAIRAIRAIRANHSYWVNERAVFVCMPQMFATTIISNSDIKKTKYGIVYLWYENKEMKSICENVNNIQLYCDVFCSENTVMY